VAQLRDQPLILREAGSGTRHSVEAALAAAGLDLPQDRVVLTLGSTQAIIQAVTQGLGIGFVSARAAAQAQVDLAQTALGVIQAQMDKMSVTAPVDGIVLTRLVEPGEVVAPGATLLTVGPLEQLTITVYIPEDIYGTINLGQVALVNVDSFPGETFEAIVTRIADQAEFTPRNVQTQEDRRTTVFAVELGIDNPDGKLKPGMPADVEFIK
jgi:multidrug resistance efflux pump